MKWTINGVKYELCIQTDSYYSLYINGVVVESNMSYVSGLRCILDQVSEYIPKLGEWWLSKDNKRFMIMSCCSALYMYRVYDIGCDFVDCYKSLDDIYNEYRPREIVDS